MSCYQQVLDIARQQAAALLRGELEVATALLDDRATLLAVAPPPGPSEVPLVEEILRLDRGLSSAIRVRMIALRDEARAGEHGKKALNGYARPTHAGAIAVDLLT